MKSLLQKAKDGKYAIANADVYDAPTVLASLKAAERCKSPLIVSWGERHDNFDEFVMSCFPLLEVSPIPVAFILDHGREYAMFLRCVKAGFNSLMADYSHLPLEENIACTKEVMRIARAVGASVEAELGHVGYGPGFSDELGVDPTLTDPEEARRFVRETGVDCLAVAVGNIHGPYRGEPRLDIDQIDRIRKAIDLPLVLHGGSGTGDNMLKEAVTHGVCKVNLFSDLCKNGMLCLNEYMNEASPAYLWEANAAALRGFSEQVEHYILLFGSDGKA